jgi:hypothetical protein
VNRFFALIALALTALLTHAAGAAQDYSATRTVVTERWVEEWDPVSGQWVRVAETPEAALASGQVVSVLATQIVNGVVVAESETVLPPTSHARFASPAMPLAQAAQGLAQYGPFLVLDPARAAIIGSTDAMSPAWFDAMLHDYPGLELLELIEAPGTHHDIANLAVGRRIRAAGLATHVPAGGSVRSGAVELFLAGAERTIADGAVFAVHSWIDADGREPQDFAADHPANRLYLDYYAEMGMAEAQARAFYAMTNSVPHARALWLGADAMRAWAGAQSESSDIALLDSRPAFP